MSVADAVEPTEDAVGSLIDIARRSQVIAQSRARRRRLASIALRGRLLRGA